MIRPRCTWVSDTWCLGVNPAQHARKRGLAAGVRLVISDQHAGLVAALKRSFQKAGHQRCPVHFARNLLALVPKTHTDMVAAVFRTIFAQPDAKTVAATWDEVRDQLAGRSVPQVRASDGRRQDRGARLPRISPGAPDQDLGDQLRSNGSTRRSSAEPVSWVSAALES